jgi:predicted ferric reductase
MSARTIFWIIAAFAAIALPFVVLLSGERVERESQEFLWDFSKGLGFAALAVSGLQFVLTARFRRLAHPFGLDIVYLFHRYLAIGAVVLMLGHFAILYIWYEDALGVLNPLEARWELTAGRVALVCFIGLVVSSEFRKLLRLEYGFWRYLHVGLAVLGFSAAVAHVLGVGQFTALPGTRALWLGVTLGFLLTVVWVRIGKPVMQRANPWKVVENIAERGGVHSLVMEPQGRPLAPWRPGQFGWLTLQTSPFGFSEHPFTISSPPEEGPRVTMSIKPLGDFSQRAIETEVGATAYLDGPYGIFSIDSHREAEGFVMIAGGVGVTPMMANLRSMRARKDMRPVVLVYANPNYEDVTFREELEALENVLNLKVVHVLNEPPENWEGEEGYVTGEVLARHLGDDTRGYEHFLCGPKPMTDGVREALEEMGVSPLRIETELFDMV